MTVVIRIKHQALIPGIIIILFLLAGCGKGTPTKPTPLQTATGDITPTLLVTPGPSPYPGPVGTQTLAPYPGPFETLTFAPYPGPATGAPTQAGNPPYPPPETPQARSPSSTPTIESNLLPPTSKVPSPTVTLTSTHTPSPPPGGGDNTPYPPPGPGDSLTQTATDESPYPGPAVTDTLVPTLTPTPLRTGTVQVTSTQPGPTRPSSTPTPTTRQTPNSTPTPIPTERPVKTDVPVTPPAIKTVTLWHSWSPDQVGTLNILINAYQQVYPDNRIEAQYVPYDELPARYEEAAYFGGGPDILLGPAEWGPRFYDQGLVLDLTSIAGNPFLATINWAALGEARYRNALIGLPYAIRSGVVMYRNKNIISTAPTTFNELVTLARAATHGGKVGAYLDRGFLYSGASLLSTGGSLMDSNGYPTFNNTRGIEWLTFLNQFTNAGPTCFNSERDLQLFKLGKIGIIIDGTWNLGVISDTLGLQNLAIDPWPTFGNGRLSGFVQADNLYVNNNLTGDTRYTTLQVAAFFLAPEVQTILAEGGHIPAVLDVSVIDPVLQQEMAAFELGMPYPIDPKMDKYWNPLETAMQALFTGALTPSVALQRAFEAIVAGQ